MDIRTPVATIYGDLEPRFREAWKLQIDRAKEKFGAVIEDVLVPPQHPCDVPIVFVKKENIIDVLNFFKNDLEYQFLSDLTATDEMPAKPRFHVVYNLFSHTRFNRIRIKVKVDDGEQVPTAIPVWPAANWAEREVFDMFGVKFKGHPDLRRILMDERWVGHPLRKDYDLKGYQIFSTPQVIRPELLEGK